MPKPLLARHYAPAAEVAEALFRENSSLSIDAAARLLKEHCFRHHLPALHKTHLSRLRHQARGTQSAESIPVVPNTPKRSTHSERLRWLHDWALANANATVEQTREALRGEFGMAVGTAEIAEALRIMHKLHEEDRRVVQRPAPSIQEIERMMELARICKIERTKTGLLVEYERSP